jgi:cell division protein ZapA
MSNVTLSIGGRTFTVSCADGEESHVSELGGLIDIKVEALGHTAGQNEVRMLLYAALVLADELKEARSTIAQHAASAPTATPALSEKLEKIAVRIENIAERLEAEAGDA